MTASSADQGIIWSDDFLIGIAELDYEHRRLIEDINKLHRELHEPADMDGIKATLGTIHSRMQAHFALEERVMVRHGYAHYPEHAEANGQDAEVRVHTSSAGGIPAVTGTGSER